MSERPPIVALDGNHRVGKGTQLALTAARLRNAGYTPHILRCDGSRPGLGGSASDPESAYWQNFKDYAKEHDDPYEAWREGARRLIGEAARKIMLVDLSTKPVILYDRSYLSRTQMALKEGLSPCPEALYGTPRSDREAAALQRLLELTTPDMLFYLDVPTEDLLERLTPDDPKYVFRRRNIMSSAISFDDAFKHYEDSDNCLRINGNLEPIEVQEQIECAILASNILDSTRSRND